MVKVITYGTYDLFHEGHYNLLKNAKALGDYLIVGVTSDYFDKSRGKFNVRDSLMTRIDNVRATGFADEIVVEEYFGQKIDDIKRFNVDIFTVGSDWEGYFDYLNEYCKVVYLPRTQGISSTQIRNSENIRLGIIGNEVILDRFLDESKFVSGIDIIGGYTEAESVDTIYKSHQFNNLEQFGSSEELLDKVDAVYINVDMGKQNGIRIAKNVLEEFSNIKIIFTSSNLNDAVDIFTIDPMYFLVKPYSEDYVRDSIYKLMNVIQEEQTELVSFKSAENKGKMISIKARDIYYIESELRVIHIYTVDTKYTTYMTLDDMQNKLKSNFLRCHRSFIVNKDKINPLRENLNPANKIKSGTKSVFKENSLNPHWTNGYKDPHKAITIRLIIIILIVLFFSLLTELLTTIYYLLKQYPQASRVNLWTKYSCS